MEKGRIVDSGDFESVFRRRSEGECLDLCAKRADWGKDNPEGSFFQKTALQPSRKKDSN
jgi:hypothetical protein